MPAYQCGLRLRGANLAYICPNAIFISFSNRKKTYLFGRQCDKEKQRESFQTVFLLSKCPLKPESKSWELHTDLAREGQVQVLELSFTAL